MISLHGLQPVQHTTAEIAVIARSLKQRPTPSVHMVAGVIIIQHIIDVQELVQSVIISTLMMLLTHGQHGVRVMPVITVEAVQYVIVLISQLTHGAVGVI